MGLKSIFNNILHITNSCFITNILLQVKKMYNWQKYLLEKWIDCKKMNHKIKFINAMITANEVTD